MDDGLVPKLFASLCCLSMWAPIAALGAYGAHRRMVAVEAKDGGPASPAHELPLLLYAVASTAWPFAFVLACIGLGYRKWVRVGRTSTFILLAHFTVAVLGSLGIVLTESQRGPEPLAIVGYACAMLLFGALLFTAMAWRWAGARAERIARGEPSGAELGLVRFGVYALGALVPIAGVVTPLLLSEPQHAHVAKITARVSLVALLLTALAVCAGLLVLIASLEAGRIG
jgi:hypothetical protein